jgi:hypothetical protein
MMEATMRICTNTSTLPLAAGQVATLRDAQGTRIECLSGSLWITQQDEGRDIVLASGDQVILDRGGKVVVQAFKPSLVLVFESRPAAPGIAWLTRLAHAVLCHFMGLGMRRSAWRRAYRI